jgi:hypothetical protein
MSSNETQILPRIEAAKKLGQSAFVETFEQELNDPVVRLGNEVLAHPSVDRVANWLRIFAQIANLSLEGPSDITAKLRDKHRDVFDEALPSLSPDERRIIEDFADSLDEADLDIAAFTSPARALSQTQVLARFIVTESFDGSRKRVWRGKLVVLDRDRNQAGIYTAQTGGFVADYRRPNGPTPPGTYKVSNYRPNRFKAPGMVRDGVAFSFDLNEVDGTPVFGRSAFRIHPDQDPPGTHGCIGVAEKAAGLRDCAAKLERNLKDVGPFHISVIYGNEVGV